jgi:NAD(P)-dependent dehydrogenase (short-subunit alcohol dehydrogenase family)
VLTQAMAAQVPPAADENGEPQAQGLIVNMIDQRVRKLTPEFMTYTIAKMGLWALTRDLGAGAGPARCGSTPSARARRCRARASRGAFRAPARGHGSGRGADPEGICAALDYLLQARAVTGQLICVDGGQHLAWQTPDVLGVE